MSRPSAFWHDTAFSSTPASGALESQETLSRPTPDSDPSRLHPPLEQATPEPECVGEDPLPGATWVDAPNLPGGDSTLHRPQPGPGEPLGRVSDGGRDGMEARAVWQKALGELQLQLAASSYTTWLHDTWVEAYEDGEFVVGTPNPYARDWLQNRLRALIRKTLKGIVGRTVDVRFIVKPHETQDRPDARPAPLYAVHDGMAASPPERPAGRLGASDGAERRASSRHILLNSAYTFETYIVGNNNRFAVAAAQAVAERPGFRFNPLFVHGGVGLGKTHLLHAIGNALQERGHQVLYCSSEAFTNDLISAIRSQNTENFRNRYRELDALLIDDIQFIAGKESTQEEFFHTFNHLHSIGKQIVVTSDRPPKALPALEERLRSRFEGGIQVDVSAPDFETRVAILQSKAARMGILVGLDVLKLVAERVESNIRELEGALNHLFLQAQMTHSPLSLMLATDTLNNVAPQRKPCSAPRLLELVAAFHDLAVDDLTGQRRTRPLADARHVAMYLLREDLALSLPVIGQWLGGRDHTTVAHAVDKITMELRTNEELRRRVAILRERIYTPYAG